MCFLPGLLDWAAEVRGSPILGTHKWCPPPDLQLFFPETRQCHGEAHTLCSKTSRVKSWPSRLLTMFTWGMCLPFWCLSFLLKRVEMKAAPSLKSLWRFKPAQCLELWLAPSKRAVRCCYCCFMITEVLSKAPPTPPPPSAMRLEPGKRNWSAFLSVRPQPC